MLIADTKQSIQAFTLLSLRGRLQLEEKGMKISRGPSALAIAKSYWPEVKNRQMALDKIATLLQTL